jgi:hypothetical protein
MKHLIGIYLILSVLLLAACVPAAAPEVATLEVTSTPPVVATLTQPATTTPVIPTATMTLAAPTFTPTLTPTAVRTPSPVVPVTGAVDDYDSLENLLRESGARVIPAGILRQPFFDVNARVLTVNNHDIQVFEFADVEARRASEAAISAGGETIGNFRPNWINEPHFWSQGRLIVLYVGEDEETIELLDEVMGGRVSIPDTGSTIPPQIALEAQRILSDQLGVDINRIRQVRVESVQWPDACLGLAAQGEMCAQVVTPGYRLLMQVDNLQYEVRTDLSGQVIRLGQQLNP